MQGHISLLVSPRGFETFSMLSSVEHEILNAHKYINIKKLGFLGSDKSRMLFFPLINVTMPTNIYELENLYAQLS